MTTSERRQVYCVLSALSLPYAVDAMRSLVTHCLDDIELTLITDTADDKRSIGAAMASIGVPSRHGWRVFEQAQADPIVETKLAGYPNIAAFRLGHPCWRKITDPLLFAEPGAEMIIIDPDLYFPNRFRFEPTPPSGILLMYQHPICLLPHEVVDRAYTRGIRLANHVDIGVAQARNAFDLPWLDRLIADLGGRDLPRAMHVEAIVWAALAMHAGGGYLDPEHWRCWRNSQWKRLLLRVGLSGRSLLRVERFGRMKCFHGGGIAKWWIPEAVAAGDLPAAAEVTRSVPPVPYENLTRSAYESSRTLKRWARRLGYYRLIEP